VSFGDAGVWPVLGSFPSVPLFANSANNNKEKHKMEEELEAAIQRFKASNFDGDMYYDLELIKNHMVETGHYEGDECDESFADWDSPCQHDHFDDAVSFVAELS
jgi:hypothetical protein